MYPKAQTLIEVVHKSGFLYALQLPGSPKPGLSLSQPRQAVGHKDWQNLQRFVPGKWIYLYLCSAWTGRSPVHSQWQDKRVWLFLGNTAARIIVNIPDFIRM